MSMAAAAAAAAIPTGLFAQARAQAARGRIDVHHHLYPPFYVKEMKANSNWTPAVSLDAMEKNDVATALLSPVANLVGNSLSDRSERARTLARGNNEYGAQLVKDYPGRFGLFAALPLPDQDGSLREIAYAYDVLKADGIGLWTSYVDKWLGDPAFWPAYEELNRRNAVVFVHPSRPACCSNLPGQSGIIDFDLDTARAIDSLLFNGTSARFPNVRFIFVHSGGAMSVLAQRVIDDLPRNQRAAKLPNGVEAEIKKLYFDVAHGAGRPALAALRALVPVSQILYGSDVPLRNYDLTDRPFEEYDGFSINDLKAINRGNAERLFPRLRT
jgi:predicted TIM-barrel fold metal-dependent hydrolase